MADLPKKVMVRVYIDALNFHNRIAKGCGLNWIDLKGLLLDLIQERIPNAEIEKMFLFSAGVRGDVGAQERQMVYLNALREKYGDSLEIVNGRMIEVEKRGKPVSKVIKMIAKIAAIIKGKKETVAIRVYEEKQTDVNIACQMVEDAYTVAGKDFDVACLVSNDSDLKAPLRKKELLRQETLVIFPIIPGSGASPSKSLVEHVKKENRVPNIPRDKLVKHRLPDRVGNWHCPDAPGWKVE